MPNKTNSSECERKETWDKYTNTYSVPNGLLASIVTNWFPVKAYCAKGVFCYFIDRNPRSLDFILDLPNSFQKIASIKRQILKQLHMEAEYYRRTELCESHSRTKTLQRRKQFYEINSCIWRTIHIPYIKSEKKWNSRNENPTQFRARVIEIRFVFIIMHHIDTFIYSYRGIVTTELNYLNFLDDMWSFVIVPCII